MPEIEVEDRLRAYAPRFFEEVKLPRDLHVRIMSASARPRPFWRRQLIRELAVAAAFLLFVAILTVGVSKLRESQRVSPATRTPPQSSPTPLSHELNVPLSTPLILYGDPAKTDQIDGVTWDGKENGKISTPVAGTPNPSATLFATAKEIRDRSGKLIATGSFGTKVFSGTWADDGQHICMMVPLDYLGVSGVPTTLQLITPGQAPRTVAQVGQTYEQVNTYVAACSVRFDRALVVQSGGQGVGTAQDWMVQLSSGRILWSQDFRGHASVVTVVASADCQYVAANYAGQRSNGVTIYGADGSAITPAAGQPGQLTFHVEGFSGDDSLAVTTPASDPGPVTVARWSDGLVLWRGPSTGGFNFSRSTVEPDGAGLAIGISDPAHVAQSAVDLYVIAPDGQAVFQRNDIYW